MLFGKRPQRYRPAFEVKAVAFPGLVLHDSRYLDSEDIGGTLLEQYQRSFAFIKRNLRHIQADRGFNTLGQLEIPEQAREELLVNALIHRDYRSEERREGKECVSTCRSRCETVHSKTKNKQQN